MSISKKFSQTAPMLMTVVAAFCMTTLATAQTTPGKQSPQQPGTNQHGGTNQQSGTNQQGGIHQHGGAGQQGDQRSQQGWQWFDDNAARDMNISDDNMKELRQMDDRYRKEYNAMGSTPWTHSDYQALTDRRDAEVKEMMTDDQYQQWSRNGAQGHVPSQNRNQTPSTPAPKR